MTRFSFLGYWLFTASLAALLLSNLALFVPGWAAIMGLNWLGFGFFSAFCWLMFEISQKSIKSENKQLFGQIFLLSIGLKMFFTLIIFILFMKKNPDFPRASVLSFMLLYAIFTAFEVFFMSKLSRSQLA